MPTPVPLSTTGPTSMVSPPRYVFKETFDTEREAGDNRGSGSPKIVRVRTPGGESLQLQSSLGKAQESMSKELLNDGGRGEGSPPSKDPARGGETSEATKEEDVFEPCEIEQV